MSTSVSVEARIETSHLIFRTFISFTSQNHVQYQAHKYLQIIFFYKHFLISAFNYFSFMLLINHDPQSRVITSYMINAIQIKYFLFF